MMVENTIEKTLLDELTAVALSGDAKSTVQQAIESPDLFHFGELLVLESVKNLKTTNEASYKTLELFAYGNYNQYMQDSKPYLPLNDQAIRKLRQLTLLDIIAQSNTNYISYESLSAQLGITSQLDLESLIIDASYRNLLKVRFDSGARKAYLIASTGRDLHPEHGLYVAIDQLNNFVDRCAAVLGDVDQYMRIGNEKVFEQLQKRLRLLEEYRGVKAAIEQQSELILDTNAASSSMSECPASPTSRLTARSQLSKRLKGHFGNSQSPTAKNQPTNSVQTWFASSKANVTNMFRRNASNERGKETPPSSSTMNGN